MNLLEVGIPTVPLRGMVVYPNIVIHLDIGRDKSIKAVEAAMNEDRILAVVTQKDDAVDAPTVHDLAQMGTLVKIKQMLRLPGGIVRVLVEGITRIRLMNITSMDPYYIGDYERVASEFEDDVELEAYRRLVQANQFNGSGLFRLNSCQPYRSKSGACCTFLRCIALLTKVLGLQGTDT